MTQCSRSTPPASLYVIDKESQMRITNLAFFLGIAVGVIFAYLLLDAFAQALGMPGLGDTANSLSILIVQFMLPRVLIVYAVLFFGGAVLFRFLNSEVPLRWCLALGSFYGVGYLCLMLASQNWSAKGLFLPGLFCLGMFISPILGGIQAKRIASRKRS
jgi:hypothetical protein